MNRCTDFGQQGWVFESSRCIRHGNLRAVMLYCLSNGYVRLVGKMCLAHELCVDTGRSEINIKAYCVSRDYFFQIPSSEQQRVTGEFERHIPSRSDPFAAEVLLVDQSHSHGLEGADAFELTAFRETVPARGGVPPTRVVLASVRCAGCYSLGLPSLSEETNLMRATVDIKGAGAGYLYLITIS